MDETTARIMEQMRSNPAMLQTLMQSSDGQRLIQMLTGKDRGAGLQKAIRAAAKGDTSEMATLVNQVAQTTEGTQLMQRINSKLQK